jgi:hypothetical protein
VKKLMTLVDGPGVIYTTHRLGGYAGPRPLGHHSTLALPETEGALRVAVSPFELGMTPPELFSDPRHREYQSLAIGARFDDLTKVPSMFRDTDPVDCTRLPAREGFTDLLQIFRRPGATPAWTSALHTESGYLWYSLKEASVLPSTVFWMSNKGRHGPPWDGRNRCVGLEETCSWFADGLARSVAADEAGAVGFPTVLRLDPETPTDVRYIPGVVRVPAGFGRVVTATFEPGAVCFRSASGKDAVAPVDWGFLASGEIGPN